MTWTTYGLLHILIGILIAEGGLWAERKAGRQFRLNPYFLILLLWPILMPIAIYMIHKERK